MTNEKCEDLRRALESMLTERELGWVVAALHEQIGLGKTEAEVVDVVRQGSASTVPDWTPSRGARRTLKDKFLRRVDYTPRECLDLTIDAVEKAVVEAGDIGVHLQGFLKKESDFQRAVKFAPELEGSTPKESSIPIASSRREVFAELRVLLTELRKEVTSYGR